MEVSKKWKIAQRLELYWWKRYLSKKSPIDYLIWKKQYWLSFLEKISLPISTIKNKRILDAGCGPAGINIVLENNIVDAFDPLIESYKVLPHFNPEQFPNVQFQKSTIEAFSAKEQYDLIFCLNAINHVSDIHKSYHILSESLKVGGTMVISIDAHNHNFFKHLFRLIPGDALHPHQYDLEEYRQFVAKEGLEIIANYNIEKGFFFDYWAMVVTKKIAINGL